MKISQKISRLRLGFNRWIDSLPSPAAKATAFMTMAITWGFLVVLTIWGILEFFLWLNWFNPFLGFLAIFTGVISIALWNESYKYFESQDKK